MSLKALLLGSGDDAASATISAVALAVSVGAGVLLGVALTKAYEKSTNRGSPSIDGDGDGDGAPEAEYGDDDTEYKMVFVVNQSLKMQKGKAAAQCAHAAVGAYKKALRKTPGPLKTWESHGQPKIVVKAKTLEEMNAIIREAVANGINVSVVRDAGRTQVAAGSQTVAALGPAPKDVLDVLTGDCKLY